MNKKEKGIVGWREFVALPEWGINKIKAKIDTGARTTSIHAEDIKKLPNGKISFYIVVDRRNRKKKVIATPFKRGKVKSSIGTRTQRWYVQTTLRIGSVEREVLINLMGREEMNFRILIGRKAIEDAYLVDVSHGYLLKRKGIKNPGQPKKLKKGKS